MAIGDASGLLTIMEVSKLFSEPASEEKKLMEDILQNEISRQEYMELKYKSLDEESSKPDNSEDSSEDKLEKSSADDYELKVSEDGFSVDKLKILEELGIILNISDNSKENQQEDG